VIPGPAKPPVIYQGDTFVFDLRVTEDAENGTPPQPNDLTGVLVLSQVRASVSGLVIVTMSANVAADQVTSRGVVLLGLSPTQTRALSATGLTAVDGPLDVYRLGLWDVQLTWPNGAVETVLRSPIDLQLEVSR